MRVSRGLQPLPAALALLLFITLGLSSAAGGDRLAPQPPCPRERSVAISLDPPEDRLQQQEPQAVLPSPSPALLKALGDYCELVKKMALYFVCTEKVEEKENVFSRGSGSKRSSVDALRVAKTNRQELVFDYQIIKKGYDFQEKRILLERDGKALRQENAELNTLKASAKNLFFGPVGFLSRYWQEHFRYELVGEELLGDKKAIVIRAVPSEERAENNDPGRIWIDRDTNQILRIEFEPAEWQGTAVTMDGKAWKSLQNASAPGTRFTRHFTWTVDYGQEKNGIRFPARQSIVEEYRSDVGYRITKRTITFEYTDYKFFTVDVEVKNRP